MAHTSTAIELVGIVIVLLLVAGVVRAFTKRVKLPFTVVLVLVGIALKQLADHGPALFQPLAEHAISPDVILFVFLPTLIFESAFNLDARQLKHNLLPVLTLAIPGLALSTAMIGTLVWWATPIDLPAALLLGSILSATDPVAVIALFRHLGVPMRLTTLVEGESLFNDATAIVASKILMGVVAGGYFLTPETAFGSTVEFFTVFVGGAFVGWVLAVAFGWILGRVDSDPFIETSLTTILAYLSFLVAEKGFHMSGVMAVVMAGLTMGNWGRAKISGSVAGFLEHFWEYLAFMANALIFLFVGLRVNLGELYGSLDILVWVIAAMLMSRAVVIYTLVPLVGRFPGSAPVGRAYQAVMYWGGLRGAIALAIVLSLEEFPHKELFVAVVMGAVLFTLLVQGLSIETLVHRLGLDKPPLADRLGRTEGLLSAKNQALERIQDLQDGGLFSARIAKDLESNLDREMTMLRADLMELRHLELKRDEERRLMFARAFAAEKAIYHELFTNGHLSEQAFRDLCHSIGMEADAARHGLATPSYTLHASDVGRVRAGVESMFDAALGFTGWPERLRMSRIALEYEESWGRYQGSSRVLAGLETLVMAETVPPEIVEEIRTQYSRWMTSACKRIDSTAEQFPEFVNAVQERLAKRLLVRAETKIIENEARAGSIPPGVRDTVLEELSSEFRELRGEDLTELQLDPAELLRKVPFFQDTPKEEFDRVTVKLRQRTVPSGKAIIQQGGTGETLYLISRGVIRVSHKFEGKEHDLATLFAGDFFGEMALLHHESRSATCRAVTPAAIYELKRNDFDEVRRLCPAIQEALEKADKERRRKMEQG